MANMAQQVKTLSDGMRASFRTGNLISNGCGEGRGNFGQFAGEGARATLIEIG
jgi:hypothetical protein